MYSRHPVWAWGGGVQVNLLGNQLEIFLEIFFEISFKTNFLSAPTLTVTTLEFTTSVRQTVLTGELLGKSNVFVEI